MIWAVIRWWIPKGQRAVNSGWCGVDPGFSVAREYVPQYVAVLLRSSAMTALASASLVTTSRPRKQLPLLLYQRLNLRPRLRSCAASSAEIDHALPAYRLACSLPTALGLKLGRRCLWPLVDPQSQQYPPTLPLDTTRPLPHGIACSGKRGLFPPR